MVQPLEQVSSDRPSPFRMGASPLQASADELHAVPVEWTRERSRDGDIRARGGDGHTEIARSREVGDSDAIEGWGHVARDPVGAPHLKETFPRISRRQRSRPAC
jgi:hypothetical protein